METGKEKFDYFGFLPPLVSGMDFRELFLVDDRVRKKTLGCV